MLCLRKVRGLIVIDRHSGNGNWIKDGQRHHSTSGGGVGAVGRVGGVRGSVRVRGHGGGSRLGAGVELGGGARRGTEVGGVLVDLEGAGADVWVSLVEAVDDFSLHAELRGGVVGRSDEVPGVDEARGEHASEGVEAIDHVLRQATSHHGKTNLDGSETSGNDLTDEGGPTGLGGWDGESGAV